MGERRDSTSAIYSLQESGEFGAIGEKRTAYMLVVRKPEAERPLGRPRRRWVWGLDWSGSGYGQVESSCECGNEPSGSTNCCESIEWLHNLWPVE
jgi:hypothetical protein